MTFYALVFHLFLPESFSHVHTQIERHILKVGKSYSRHSKACKYIKNQKSKILTKTIRPSIYAEKSIK